MEFESDDHKLCLWLRVKKEQEDSPRHTRVEGGAEQIARGVDVTNTGRSAGTILTGCNYAGHCLFFAVRLITSYTVLFLSYVHPGTSAR